MLNVSEELKNILRNDSFPMADTVTPKDLEIIFDGMEPIYADQIVDDSFELTESIIDDANLRFGTCRSPQIKFKLADVTEDITGKEFTANLLVDDTYTIPLGQYKVHSAKLEDDLIFKEVIAYDKLKDTDVDVSEWYNGLFPTGGETYTLKAFRSSLLAHLGIEEVEQVLPNDDMLIERTIEPSQISGRTVLEATVELNGAFGHINRQGKFTRIVLESSYGLYPSERLFPSNDLFPTTEDDISYADVTDENVNKAMYLKVKFEEYTVKEIDKLQIRAEEHDIGAIVGTGSNAYVIEGNFLVFGKSAIELEQIAINALGNMSKRPYRPYEVESIGLPYIEVGDAIQIDTEHEVVSYVLQRTLTGVQALKDNFESPGSEEREQNFGLNEEIIQLQGRYARIKKDVDGIVQTVGDVEEGVYTEIEQLADQLVLKIDSNGNLGMFKLSSLEDGTQALIKADNISLEGLITANEGFKILLDGSFEAVAGEIAGFIVVPEDESGDGGLIYTDETGSKFIRLSPHSSMDGQGGFNTAYGAIDLGLAFDGKNTLIHLRSDGYARFGLVSEGGTSVRFNDFLRYEATNGETGTDTILYSQNFQINRDGTVNIKSEDVTQPIKSIDVTKDVDESISNMLITYEDDMISDVDIEYSESGEIVKIGDTIINY